MEDECKPQVSPVRGLHSSTVRRNVSTVLGMRWVISVSENGSG